MLLLADWLPGNGPSLWSTGLPSHLTQVTWLEHLALPTVVQIGGSLPPAYSTLLQLKTLQLVIGPKVQGMVPFVTEVLGPINAGSG